MKRLILALLVALPCFATMNGTMNWEVRTTGSDNNGGGFDPKVASPGTDFSQQDSAQLAFTDLTIQSSTNQVASAAHPGNSTYPGNIIQILSGSGCTAGFYEITSMSSTNYVLDRSAGTNASVCTANLGGGLLTWQKALTGNNNNGSSPARLWIKSGTYTITTGISSSNNQDNFFIGYNSTHGDNGGSSATWPTLTTATNSINLYSTSANGNRIGFANINFTTTATTRLSAIASNNGAQVATIFNCSFTGFANTIKLNSGSSGPAFISSVTILNDSSEAIQYSGGASYLQIADSFIYNSTSHGIDVDQGSGGSISITNSVVSGNGGYGIRVGAGANFDYIMVSNCTISNNTSGGIAYVGANTNNSQNSYFLVKSNVIYGNSGIGVNNTSGAPIAFQFMLDYNAVGSNTGGNYASVATAGSHDVALTANPFVASGSGNFALNSTAGGGAAVKAAGFPGAFYSSSTTGYHDIGGVQSQCAAAGAAACGFARLVSPRINAESFFSFLALQ